MRDARGEHLGADPRAPFDTAHLVFALATTGYILAAIQLEERDLVDAHGDVYRRYREDVPMLVPRPRWRLATTTGARRRTARPS